MIQNLATHRRLGILLSGRGSNMAAILDAIADGRLNAEAAVVISNRPTAAGLTIARDRGVPTVVIDHGDYAGRSEHDAAVIETLRGHDVDLVCLAGYMRLLSPDFVNAYPERVLNIHPSILPAFPGLHAQRNAVEYGVKVAGCSVHFVTAEMDAGPIIRQAVVAVKSDDTEETLSARILNEEHRIYPEAIALVLDGRTRLDGRVVRIENDDIDPETGG